MAPPPKDYWFHMRYWAYILPLAYIISFIYTFAPLGGFFTTIEDLNVESCEKISGINDFRYCEDAILSDEPGVVYTSCDPEKTEFNKVMGLSFLAPGQAAKSGDIWKVAYTEAPARIEKFDINKEFDSTTDFHPLGLSIDHHPLTKKKTLVAINLPHQGDAAIDFFAVDDKNTGLVHKRTIRHPKIYSPNAVHVIQDVRFRAQDGTPSFFFTNDHYFASGILKKLENYFFYLSNVGFYNARSGQVEKGVDGLLFANGLSGTDDILFVAETNRRTVKKFEIVAEVKNGVSHITLNHVAEAKFQMAVDNVRYIAEKDLLVVAGHPKGAEFIKYIMTADKSGLRKPPSQVDVWDVSTGETKTILKDNGALFGSSSTGTIDLANSKLVVSGLVEEGLLICDI